MFNLKDAPVSQGDFQALPVSSVVLLLPRKTDCVEGVKARGVLPSTDAFSIVKQDAAYRDVQ